MLLEHALLASGDIAEAGAIYAGWPARQLEERRPSVTDTQIVDVIEEVPLTELEKLQKGSPTEKEKRLEEVV